MEYFYFAYGWEIPKRKGCLMLYTSQKVDIWLTTCEEEDFCYCLLIHLQRLSHNYYAIHFTFIIDDLFIVFCFKNYAQEKEIVLTLKHFLNN